MDDFDNMFSEVSEGAAKVEQEAKPEPTQQAGGYNNNNGGGGYNKQNYDNKPKYTNVEGKQTINVWNGDRVEPLEMDLNSLKTNEKWVTMTLGNKFYKLDENDVKHFKEIATLLKDKGYKARIICSNIAPIFKDIKAIFGDDMMLVTPWKGYCKEMIDYKQYLSTDTNLKAASFYFNNKSKKYNELPAGIKLVKSAVIASLVGLDNNELSQVVLIHDRNYDGKKLDFKQSQNVSDYVMLAKPLGLSMYNLASANDYNAIKQLLE